MKNVFWLDLVCKRVIKGHVKCFSIVRTVLLYCPLHVALQHTFLKNSGPYNPSCNLRNKSE